MVDKPSINKLKPAVGSVVFISLTSSYILTYVLHIITVVSLEVDHYKGKMREDVLQIETIKTDIEIRTMTNMMIRNINDLSKSCKRYKSSKKNKPKKHYSKDISP